MERKKLEIAIVKLSALGDIVHSSIVLQFIKMHYPNSRITWIVDKRFSAILKDHRLIDELVVLPLKDKKFIKSYKILKKFNKFDYILDLQGLLKSAIISRILGDNTYGFDKFSVKESLASNLYKHKFNIDYNENIITRNLALTAFALNFCFKESDITNKKPCFDVSTTEEKRDVKRILIAPFASEKSKCYDKFKKVINLLSDFEIFLTNANEKEMEQTKEIIKNTHAKNLEILSLKDILKEIAKADLVIGNDSGITHLAWALNIPSITIFGNRPSKRNSYKTKINLTIDAGKKIDARKINKKDFCIQDIPPKKIADMALELLYRNFNG